MTMIEIRAAQPEDANDLNILHGHMNAVLRKTYRPTKAGLLNRARISKGAHCLIACAEGKVVGTVQYYHYDACLRLMGLGVHQDYRRQGIARKLIEHVCRLSEQHRCSAVGLSTIRETGNISVFERLGFQVVVENTDLLLEGIDLYHSYELHPNDQSSLPICT